MNFNPQFQLSSWLGAIDRQIWILAFGRFLSEIGTGFTMFYAPIFFVNQVGLSATTVGVALSSASISGIIGRILGGSLADTVDWRRRRTLLLAAAISTIGSLVLATTNNLITLVIGSLIGGLGIGLYWPATEAFVADMSCEENRRATFALTRLADNFGLAIGSALAGLFVAIAHNYRWLFVIDAFSFAIFFIVIYVAISETSSSKNTQAHAKPHLTAWLAALTNRPFMIYVAVNITFTTYISQMHSTLPIYFKNFVALEDGATGLPATTISALFAWHLILAMVFQLPVTAVLKRCSHTLALSISALLWAVGFGLIWFTGITPSHHLIWISVALTVFAVAVVAYTPAAASLVTELAPESQRGVYFSINSLCWAIGNFIGYPLGGWALDQSGFVADNFWLGFSLSILISVPILQYLNVILLQQETAGTEMLDLES